MKINIHVIIKFLIFAAFVFPIESKANKVENFTFSHIGKDEGLDNLRVFSITQTADGAIWWTTRGGVDRYNGVSVYHYSLESGAACSNSAGRMIKFAKSTTENDDMYAFDNTGHIFIYNKVQNRFDLYLDITKKTKGGIVLRDVCIDGEKVWLAMREGIFSICSGILTTYKKNVYSNCIINVKGTLVFGTKSGLLCIDTKKTKAKIQNTPHHWNVESGYYDELTNKIWFGTFSDGVKVLHQGDLMRNRENSVENLGGTIPSNPVRSIIPYGKNTMLVGIDGFGVYETSRNGGKSTLLFDANEGKHGVIHGNGIYALLQDKWNNIIIGSYSGGIDIARPVGSTIAIYQHERNNLQSLQNDHVNTVEFLSGGIMMMGTDNGLSVLNTKTNQWKHFGQGMVVLDICHTSDGKLLAATYGKGVFEINPNGGAKQIYCVNNGTLNDDYVYSLFNDSKGNLWIGCLDGQLIEKTKDGYKRYDVNNVQAITELPDGKIAVGTVNGLYLINPSNNKVEELRYFPSNIADANRYILSLYVNNKTELWVGTDGGGIYMYNLKNKSFRQMTRKEGLPSDRVCTISKDVTGRLWIGTDLGLAFIDANNTSRAVDVNYCYGLNREYARGAVANLSNGYVLYGTTTGAIIINPKMIKRLNYTTKINILGASCTDDDSDLFNTQTHKSLAKNKVWLGYSQRTFDLNFEAINLRNQYDIVYQYKVGRGEWSQPTEQQFIRFVNLEPGSHKLLIRCVSKTCGITLDEIQVTITITQPWWNSWWMWILYIALLALTFYGAWKIYELHTKYMRLVVSNIDINSSGEDKTLSSFEEIEPNDNEETNDTAFVDTATKLIVENLRDSDFNIDRLCREMAMSRTLFYLKLKSYTGKSPQDFIRVIRLERAAALLRSGKAVTEVAELVGFDNPKYFSTVFKKYFGISPSKFK